VLLLIGRHATPESLVLGLSLCGLLLLLLENGRCFGGGSGGFRRLMPLVGAPPIVAKIASTASRILVLMAFSIGILSGKIGVPGATFIGGAGVVGRTLLLNQDGGIEVFDMSIPSFHVGEGHLCRKARL
jgi:hypothetical protein